MLSLNLKLWRYPLSQQYRSGLEKQAALQLKKPDYLYEPYRLPYVTYRHYVPDFVHEKKKILIECKGFFRAGDIQKYKAIRDSLKDEGWELVFILSSKKKKIRKNSKTTMEEWCAKEGFLCYTANTISELHKYIKDKKPCL